MGRARSWIVGVVLLESVGLAAACSSFSSDDTGGGGAEGGSEASTGDDKDTFVPSPDSSAPDSGVNPLVLGEDFEVGDPSSCGARWVPEFASATRVSLGRDGGVACRVCTKVSGGPVIDYYGVRIAQLQVVAGQSYVVRAYLKRDAAPSPSAVSAFAQLDYSLSDGGGGTEGRSNSLISPPADWVLYEMAATPQAPTPTLSFFAGAHPSQSSECFLLDDVTIRSQ